ncbi:MAG TPA: SRPBCC family protein [Steroidobacteraceae bacterium]|nr:SRPBCC family protein [Steroidobacteraceae bacterium]
MSTESPALGSQPRPETRPYAERFASERPIARALGSMGRRERFASQRRIAAGLGCFSIGLGLLELLAPRTLGRLIGLEHRPRLWRWARHAGLDRWVSGADAAHARRYVRRQLPRTLSGLSSTEALLIRALGLREIVSGVGILTRPRPAAWLWSRVLGDAMDLSLLGLALSSRRSTSPRLIGATAAVLGVTALDVLASVEFTRIRRAGEPLEIRRRRVPLEATMLINRSPEECYRLWRDLNNLPRFMESVESVRIESDTRSHWIATGPGGLRLEWDSEIVSDTPNRLISWRSLDADVPHAGAVHFDPAPGGRGTLVRVRMNHGGAPGGAFSRLATRMLGRVPQLQIREDLRRFKRLLETGEIPTTRGQPSGRRGLIARTFGRGVEP